MPRAGGAARQDGVAQGRGPYGGPCGAVVITCGGGTSASRKEGHCESYVSSGALWDFAVWDLPSGCGGRNATYPDYNCPGAGGPYNAARRPSAPSSTRPTGDAYAP